MNITSIGARQPTPGLGHYEASKAAVEALTRSAAIELASRGIRVNAVAPGPARTPMAEPLTADAAARAAWEQRIPLARIAEVADVVPAVVFLASSRRPGASPARARRSTAASCSAELSSCCQARLFRLHS